MADRQQSITSFKEVCAVNDAKAAEFLTHCDFNLERAVQLYFQTGGVLDNTNEGFENERNWENELRRRGGLRRDDDDEVQELRPTAEADQLPARAANNAPRRNPSSTVATRQMSWVEWFMAVAALPVNLIFSTLYDILEQVAYLFGFGGAGTGREPEVIDAKGDVVKFITAYNAKIAPRAQYQLQFVDESHAETCARAKRELCPLLVYLHDDKNSNDFLRDSLSTRAIGDLVAANEMLVWGASTATPEGQRVARHLRARSTPFVCLMAVKDGRFVTNLRLNAMPADRLVANLALGVNMLQMHLRQMRAQQHRRLEDARIRAEQEAEYKEGLAADRAKKEAKLREEREKREKEEEQRREIEERENCKRMLEEKRQEIKDLMTAEVTGESVRVQIRFPSGEKLEKKFALDDTVEGLFNAVLCHPTCPDLFSLYTNFPRRPLPFVPDWYAAWRVRAHPDAAPCAAASLRSFREEGLLQSLVVMVQDDAA